MKCPPGSGIECQGQPDPSTSEGCSAGDLAYWFKDSVISSEAAESAAEAKAADADVGASGRLQSGAERARCEAITSSQGLYPRWAEMRYCRLPRCRKRAALPADDGPRNLFNSSSRHAHGADRHGRTFRGIIMRISARNQIRGTVVEVQEGCNDGTCPRRYRQRPDHDIGDHNEAVDDLGIKSGGKVTAVIKAFRRHDRGGLRCARCCSPQCCCSAALRLLRRKNRAAVTSSNGRLNANARRLTAPDRTKLTSGSELAALPPTG